MSYGWAFWKNGERVGMGQVHSLEWCNEDDQIIADLGVI